MLQICENIKQARVLRGYSQQEMADFLNKEPKIKGLTRSTYRNWEEKTEPDLETIRAIARVLEIPAYTLLNNIIEYSADPEIKTPDSEEPGDLPTQVINDIEAIRISLDKLLRKASKIAELGINVSPAKEELPLGKKSPSGKKQKRKGSPF